MPISSFRQPDLFGDVQSDLFGESEPARPTVYRGDPDRVRARLTKILAEARAAETVPWSRNDEGMYELIVPQMTNWLPDEEAERWRSDFSRELTRLRGG